MMIAAPENLFASSFSTMMMLIVLVLLPVRNDTQKPMDFVYSSMSNLTTCSRLYMHHAINYSILHNCLIGNKNHSIQYICEDRHFDLQQSIDLNLRKKQEKVKFLKISCKQWREKCVCGHFEVNQIRGKDETGKKRSPSRCIVQELIKEYFQGLNDLEFLDLSWNDITSILPDLFHNMPKLLYLDISHNPLHNPSNYLFQLFHFHNLVILKMNSDFDDNVQSQIQCNNCSVYFLEMSKNNFSHSALSSVVNSFEKIDILFLNNNRIISEEFNSLPKIPNLLVLNFSNNSFSHLPNHFFMNNSNLIVLDLSKNGIADFEDHTFSGLNRLRVLALSFNNITHLRKEVFEPLTSLEYLLLNHNKISNLNIDVLTFTDKLHSIMLYENQIGALNGSFSSVLSLKSLDLSNNNLKHIFKANFEGCSHLQHLYLNENQIDQIEEDSFQDMNSLYELNMYGNQLSNMSGLNALLSKLKNLSVIRLDNNLIRAMPNSGLNISNVVLFQVTKNELQIIKTGTFTGMTKLEMLYLSYNKIHTIEPGSFPSRLKILKLKGNKLTTISAQFNNLNSLKYLVISHNYINSFDKEKMFRNLPNLITLNLCHNNLSRFPSNAFSHLQNLEDLILCRNKLNIDFKTNNPFSGLVRLKGLDLAYNEISSIDGLLTSSHYETCTSTNLKCRVPLFRHLSELYLTSNNIQMISYKLWDKKAFISASETNPNIRLVLDTLDLRGNKINYIRPDAFDDLSIAPLKIHLQYNQLRTFEPFVINDRTEIILDKNPILCDCRMKWLKENNLTSVKHTTSNKFIRNYHLTYCEVLWKPKSIKLFQNVEDSEFLCPKQTCNRKCKCFTGQSDGETEVAFCIAQNLTHFPAVPQSITRLNIQFNNFTEFTTPQLYNQTFMIESINLSYSGIMHIAQNALKVFPHLRVLDLQGNHIKALHDDIFSGNPKLEVLLLNGNNLSTLTQNTFRGIRNLKHLYLHENQLSVIDSMVVDSLSRLPLLTVTARNNNFACTCENTELLSWLAIKLKVSDAQQIVLNCDNSSYLLSDTKITSALLHCTDDSVENQNILIVLFLCSIIVIFIVAFIMWYYRATAFNLFYPVIQKFSKERPEASLYDAYLSYADEDLGWIKKEFLPKMEDKNSNYKFCVEDRDFIPGGNKAESIYHGISQSQKVIFFISSFFLQNEWCLYEMECAHRQYLLEQKDRLVAVYFNSISSNDVPKDVKVYISNAQKLYMNKSLFWDKLFYRLSRSYSRSKSHSKNRESVQNPLLPTTFSDSFLSDRNRDSSKQTFKTSSSNVISELSTTSI